MPSRNRAIVTFFVEPEELTDNSVRQLDAILDELDFYVTLQRVVIGQQTTPKPFLRGTQLEINIAESDEQTKT